MSNILKIFFSNFNKSPEIMQMEGFKKGQIWICIKEPKSLGFCLFI